MTKINYKSCLLRKCVSPKFLKFHLFTNSIVKIPILVGCSFCYPSNGSMQSGICKLCRFSKCLYLSIHHPSKIIQSLSVSLCYY